ncbi:hypothetical protein DB42_EB00050 [Neochlamydia sp. EPS4]|nr:hypothetical protein DB42_EB00050 [Neochlamydia sp. EPS4]
MIGGNWHIVFHHSVEELKQGTKKSHFSQIRQRINLILLATPKLPRHLIPKNLWLLLNAWKVSPLSLNLSEKKRCYIIWE